MGADREEERVSSMTSWSGQRPVHDPQVLWRDVAGEMLLLRMDTGQVSVLNGIGGQMWALMDGSRTLGEIVVALQESYDVAPEQLAVDVMAFVQDLLDREMLSWSAG